MWSPVIEPLAAHHEVIAVDMPGFGRSPMLPAGTAPSAANLADAVMDFYDSLAIGTEPAVAGISMGGWVAIECGRSGRARAAIGLCSAGFWREPLGPRQGPARSLARLLSPLAPLLVRSERFRRAVLSGQMRHPERLSPAEALAMIRAYAHAPGYEGANAQMRANVVADVSEIAAPLTLAWAEHDTSVRRSPLRALPASVRQPLLEGCGHIPTWDDPELVSRVILEGARAGDRVESGPSPGSSSGGES
jgi:pimeloyl-ACP methyl ester carboxylesterase